MTEASDGRRVWSSRLTALVGEVLQLVPDGVCLEARDGRAVFVNDAFRRMFRVPPSGVDTVDLGQYVRGASGEAPWIDQGVHGRWRGQLFHRRTDGARFLASHESVVIRARGGLPCCRAHVVRDLTDAQQADRAIRESEERYRVVLQSITDAVLIVNADGLIETVNDAAAALQHVASGPPAPGTPLDRVFPRRMARQRLAAMAEVLVTRTTRRLEERSTAGSGPRFLSTSVSPLINADGGCAKVVMVSRDVTAHRENEAILHRFSRSLSSAHDAEQTRTAGGLATAIRKLRDTITGYRAPAAVLPPPSPAPGRPTTIMLVDEHGLLRSGLRLILEDHHYSVVAEAGNAVDAMRLVRLREPTLVILDVGLPGMRGIELGAEILRSHPQTRLIFLTVHRDEELVYQALSIGASGYVLKDGLDTEVLDAVRCVERGGRYLTPLISGEIVRTFSHRTPQAFRSVFDGLTVRERQVVTLLCEGESSKRLAAGLGISVRTVEHHRQAIMKKLGVHSVAELIRLAIRYKLINV